MNTVTPVDSHKSLPPPPVHGLLYFSLINLPLLCLAPKRPENGPSKVVMPKASTIQKSSDPKVQKLVASVSKVNDNGIIVENDDQIESTIRELVRQAPSSQPLTINVFKNGESVEAKLAELKAETKKLENLQTEFKAIVDSRNSLQQSIIDLVATFK